MALIPVKHLEFGILMILRSESHTKKSQELGFEHFGGGPLVPPIAAPQLAPWPRLKFFRQVRPVIDPMIANAGSKDNRNGSQRSLYARAGNQTR